jgi:hypothetical protein
MFGELFLWAALLGKSVVVENRYASDPVERMQQLMYDSENLKQVQDEVERFWMQDQPSHLTPERTQAPAEPKRKTIKFTFTFSVTVDETSVEPAQRMNELMYESFHSGPIMRDREGPWIDEQPFHLTPDRTHGGVR